jgi:hypothetical protein
MRAVHLREIGPADNFKIMYVLVFCNKPVVRRFL